ncbi:MAG: methyltransferase domain-containing protein, partial [Bdellovibrionota bacterium]
MQPWLLELLCCPVTGESLSLEMKRAEGDTILEGLLRSSSGREYFIGDGIPRLLPSAQVGLRTRESFGLQWQKKREGKMDSSRTCYGYDLEAQTDWICREILGEESGGGKLLLDAGCGIGDKGGPLSERGYRVVAFDLTDAVDGARERHGESDNLCFVQADALHPPFKKNRFDVALAIGSLHHTPDAHGGFRAIASLAKEKSRLGVWLYPKDRREVNPVLSKLYRIRDALPGLQRLPPRAIYA